MNGSFSWLYFFNYYIIEIENNPADLLSSSVDSIEEELINEES